MSVRRYHFIAMLSAMALGACGPSGRASQPDHLDASGGASQGADADVHPREAGASPSEAGTSSREAGVDSSIPAIGDAAGRDARADDGGVAPEGGAAIAAGQWVLGYYASYQRDMLPPEQVDWSGLTHIVVTRLKTDGRGGVARDLDVDATNGPLLARDLSTRAHQNGKKALLMLGGAGEGATLNTSSNSANRATFVRNLLQAVVDLGYDGLDLDWEEQIDWDSFIALARDLRASPMAPPGLILTADGFPINGNYMSVEPKIASLVQHLDRFSLMTYHPATAFAGAGWVSWHNCPLGGVKGSTPVTIADSLDRYVKAGVPKAKLAMGVAYYAICYTGNITMPNQSTESGVQIRGGDNDFPLSALFANGGAFNATYRQWDSEAQVPYLSLPTAESHGCRYVSFDDEQSLEAKGAFSRKSGYGGIIVWTINQGHLRNSSKPANALSQALKRGFLDP
jgi:chitinase